MPTFHQITQRQKQIDLFLGKGFVCKIPKPPKPTAPISKRAYCGLMRMWKKQIWGLSKSSWADIMDMEDPL